MINVSAQIEITTVGDGENHTDSWSYTNTTGVPPSSQALVLGNNTVLVPLGARGVCIVPPSSTSGGSLKGVAGDAGASIFGAPGMVAVLRFPPGGIVTSFVIQAFANENWTFIWL